MSSSHFEFLEKFFRRLFDWLGGSLDVALRRDGEPQLDPSALLPRIEKVIERSLRQEGERLAAPHQIELRYSYETWSALGEVRRQQLERELAASLFEYAHNRRYLMAAPLSVNITCDAFTRDFEIRPSFGDTGGAPASGSVATRIVLVEQRRGRRHEAELQEGGEPVGIGRNIANRIVISDPTISNFHAALIWRDRNGIELADRGGANGTAINGVQLAGADRQAVKDGDLLRLGAVECRLLIEE